MGFPLFIVYLVLEYTRPFDIFPDLAPFRLMLWMGLLALSAAFLSSLSTLLTKLRSPQVLLMAALVVAIALSRLDAEWLSSPLWAILDFMPCVLFFTLVILTITSLRRFRIMATFLVVLTLLAVTQGLLAYHFGFMEKLLILTQQTGPSPTDADSGEDDNPFALKRIRSLGLLHNPNNFAQGVLTALPLLGVFWCPRRRLRNLLLLGPIATLFLYAVYLTYSRQAVLAIAVLVLLILRRRMGNVFGFLGAGLLGVALVAGGFGGGREYSASEGSARGRLLAWEAGMVMLKEHPVFGVGFQNFASIHHLSAHNSFLNALAELGFFGYSIWISLIVYTFSELNALQRLPPDDAMNRSVARCARATGLCLAAFLVCAFFAERNYVPMLYWTVGMGAALGIMARQTGIYVEAMSLKSLAKVVVALEVLSVVVFKILARYYGA